jgi:ABC-2 type transport system permease protein
MLAVYRKELSLFLSSLTGLLAIFIFLILLGLFLWVLPSESTGTNVLDNGFAQLDGLFSLAPWLYLFLIPAICMRSISEELKSGTLEFLLTKPLSARGLVLAKFMAGFTLVVISLLPTLFYVYVVYQLGNPKGNIDWGGLGGSYLGLLLLASVFLACGIFSSTFSEQQITSFLLALLICFFLYNGFDIIAQSGFFGAADSVIKKMGISEHYESISRGVVDFRDLIYFFSVSALFLILTAQRLRLKR